MHKRQLWLAGAIATLALAPILAGSAQAQPFRGGGSATLYELPNFEGRSVTITGSTPDLGDWRFNDRARSARFEGRWRICEHDDFRGRCQEVRGEVPDLNRYGLAEQISSLEPAGFGGPGPGPGSGPGPGDGWGPRPPGGWDSRGVDGTRTVFFARPTVRGMDLAAGKNGADTFCRRQGLGPAAWFDDSERASRALGPEGEITGRSRVIRDLLCLRY
jgi:hypothetical protein